MATFKKIVTGFPEYYLIILVLATGFTPPFSFNPIAIGVAVIIVLQIVYKNKLMGIVIAGLLIAVSLFMFLALVSEFNEFPVLNVAAIQLLLVGLSLIILNVVVAGIMIYGSGWMDKTMKTQNSPSH